MSVRPSPLSRNSVGASASAPLGPCRPLVVTDDPDLLDEVLRLCAAAGVEPEVSAELSSARTAWGSAPAVVVGASAARSRAKVLEGLPRRDGVLLVGLDGSDASVWESAVAVGAEEVLLLPRDEVQLVDILSETGDGSPGPGLLVAVVGGRGGAGASTLAAGLAMSAPRAGWTSTLIDADPLGGGLDMVLGAEDAAGARWPDLGAAKGRITAGTLENALPRMEGVSVLSWDRGDLFDVPAEAMHAVLSAARRGTDLVVVDLPRRFDAAAEVALTSADITLLLVPAEVRAAAAATRVAAAAGLLTADLRLVVRGPGPAGLPSSGIATALALPLAGELRLDPALPMAAERGEPPIRRRRGSLSAFCDPFLASALPPARRSAA